HLCAQLQDKRLSRDRLPHCKHRNSYCKLHSGLPACFINIQNAVYGTVINKAELPAYRLFLCSDFCISPFADRGGDVCVPAVCLSCGIFLPRFTNSIYKVTVI